MSMKDFKTLQSISKIVKGKYVSLTTDAGISITKEGYVSCTLHSKYGTSTAYDKVHYADDLKKSM
jgi:hypothetical protein